MTPLADLLLKYQAQHFAIPAFNIDSFEIYQAVEAAVKETGLPCIVQLSSGEDKFIQAERLLMLVKKANAEGLPIYLNMDHGKDLDRLKKLVSLGFDMVHFDGSFVNYSTNLSTATTLISDLKKINPQIVVEVEFNQINLINNGVSPESYTLPEQALDFMATSQADLLAVSIGNLHGLDTNQPEIIDLNRLKSITQVIPQNLLTLHGGSGISPDLISSAINLGIVKININSALRSQFKQSLQNTLTSVKSEKIYDYLHPVITDLTSLIVQKLKFYSNTL